MLFVLWRNNRIWPPFVLCCHFLLLQRASGNVDPEERWSWESKVLKTQLYTASPRCELGTRHVSRLSGPIGLYIGTQRTANDVWIKIQQSIVQACLCLRISMESVFPQAVRCLAPASNDQLRTAAPLTRSTPPSHLDLQGEGAVFWCLSSW